MHFVKYNQKQILFYAIVDHNSLNSCISVNKAYDFFKRYNLSTVSVKDHGSFDNLMNLNMKLKEIFLYIFQSPIESEGEGSVIYFVKINENKTEEQVLSLCKIKTMEYLIFRNLREKLKSFHSCHHNFTNSLDKFRNETHDLSLGFILPRPFQYYIKVAKKYFKQVTQYPSQIQECFLKNLTKIRQSIEKKGILYENSEEEVEEEEEEFEEVEEKKEKEKINIKKRYNLHEQKKGQNTEEENEETKFEENIDKKHHNLTESLSIKKEINHMIVEKDKKKKKRKKKKINTDKI